MGRGVGVRNIMLLGSALHVGGAERVIANLAKFLNPAKFNVTVCHLKELGDIGAELKACGHSVVEPPSTRHGIRRYFSFQALGRVLEEHRIELVHTHTTYAMSDTFLCRYLRLQRVRSIHSFHFGNYPHCPFRYRMLEWVASRSVDRLVAVGEEQSAVIMKTYGLPIGSLDVIVNGVVDVKPNPDTDWSKRLHGENCTVIGTICTFIEQKGLPDLLRVAQAMRAHSKQVVFVVVGDGPLRRELEQECVRLDLQNTVLFAGWKSGAAITMMPLFDIFFQPSLWEAMSMVVLEAMAASKPVVVTDVGDNRHVVSHGETGFVVPARDVSRMVDALLLLIRSPERRKAFGYAGRRRYEEKYTVQVMTQRYEALYSRVLEGVTREEV